MTSLRFLTLAEVLLIHADQIENYGGTYGTRDPHLLQSAIAMPESSFGGEWMHPGIFDKAAAYLYHLCQNHPFLDGNKRVALATALVFLDLNGFGIQDDQDELYDLVIDVTIGKADKARIASFLQAHSNPV